MRREGPLPASSRLDKRPLRTWDEGSVLPFGREHFDTFARCFKYPREKGRVQGDRVYEWLPASIVAGTFLLGLFAEAYEAGRLRAWRARLGLHPR